MAKEKRYRMQWLPWVLVLLATVWLALLAVRLGPIGYGALRFSAGIDGSLELAVPAGKFILIYTATGLACLALLIVFPRGISQKKAIVVILGAALVCRAALLALPPSDDTNRYLWEGRLIREGISPYSHPPNAPELAALAEDDAYHGAINHPGIPAAYPPLTLLLLAACGGIAYSVWPIKMMVVMFDIGALVVLFDLLRRRGLDPRWAALYAFNPVVLYAFAGQGHIDAIQNFFVVLAVALYDRRRWGWMFIAAGLAVQSKWVAAVAVPFFWRKDNLRFLLAGVLAVLAPYLPFLLNDGLQVFTGLRAFADEFAANGSIHALLRVTLGGIAPATAISRFLFAACWILAIARLHPQLNPRHRDDPVAGIFFSLGALILLSPTVHFWYLSWIIPFLVLRPARSWLVLCLSIGGCFTAFGIQQMSGRWQLPWGIYLVEWVPFYLLFVFDAVYALQRHFRPFKPGAVGDVSAIIPTRNEARKIGGCVKSLIGHPSVTEVLVVDGGSADDTVARARAAGARVIIHPNGPQSGGGRGGQISRGVREARGDVVAVVHADTRVPPAAVDRVLYTLRRQPDIVGGAVGNIFDGRRFPWRVLEWANDFRAVCMGITFGDQVQFFRRRPVSDGNLFPDVPLMEDVELSLRLRHLGRQTFLFGNASVSIRRWRSAGFSHTFLVLRLIASYLWQRLYRKPDTLAMYRRYYGTK